MDYSGLKPRILEQQQQLLLAARTSPRQSLKFSPLLEQQFISDHMEKHATIRMVGLLFLAFFALPTMPVETIAGSAPGFAAHAMPYQLLLITLPCASAAVVVFAFGSTQAVRVTCYTAVLISAVGFVALNHVGHQHHVSISYLYPSGVLLIAAGLMHFAARPMLVVVVLTSVIQLQAISVTATAGYSASSIMLLCFAINAISWVNAWYNEINDRDSWLTTRVLREKIYIDELTELLNRRGFWHHFSRLVGQTQRTSGDLALLVLSIDNFSSFQQKYGFAAGDHLLTKVGTELTSYARRPMDLVARLDAGTFALCWHQADAEFVRQAAQKLVNQIARLPLRHSGEDLGYVTISAGCATTDPTKLDLLSAEGLIESAGKLLQQSLDNGGNGVAFPEEDMARDQRASTGQLKSPEQSRGS